jgi:lysophospholipase L1-like esterase
MTSFAGRAAATHKKSLATFGDSITAGASVPEAARWANRLAAHLNLVLSNKGISGTVLQASPDASGRPRPDNGFGRYCQALLGDDRSDVIAVLYGFNDARYVGAPDTFNRDGFVRDYSLLLEGLIAAGYAPADICIGSPPHLPDAGFSVGSDGFAGQTREQFENYVETVLTIARSFGVFYAPVHESMQARGSDALILPDLVHPNADGHAVIAAAFAAATIPM